MKTKKVRPVLVKGKNKVHDIYMIDNLEYQIDKKISMNGIEQQLILISLEDEKIEVGDKVHFEIMNGLIFVKENSNIGYNPDFCKKVIANQDQLSPELIQQLVDEYNNGGMKDFEIEMKDWCDYDDDCTWGGLDNSDYRPKLTNGFVTVAEENNCTKDITNGWGNLSKEQLDAIHPKKSTREQAMEWWNNLCWTDKFLLMKEEFSDRHPQSLTGREIEEIWRQWHEDFVSKVMGDNKKLVDFEMLKYSLPMFEACVDNCQPEWNKYTNNLKLFFKKLSESGSFAHKAHKELQRLNK
jgi:hypothetical protein